MEDIRIYVPDRPVKGVDPSPIDWQDIVKRLESGISKSVAYFDENVDIYIVTKSEERLRGKLILEIQYSYEKPHLNTKSSYEQLNQKRTGRTYSTTLHTTDYEDDSIKIWKYTFSVMPGRNYNHIVLNATFEKAKETVNTTLKPFEEVNLIQIEGIDLLNNSCIVNNEYHDDHSVTAGDGASLNSQNNANYSNLVLTTSFKLNITSLYKMSLKSFKTEKTVAWLDLVASKIVNDLKTSIQINSIEVECSSCDVSSCTPMQFPLDLKPNLLLTMAYHVSYDTETSVKPLVVKVTSVVDNHKVITTQWISSLDLSNSNILPVNNSGSSINLATGKKIQHPALMPPAQISKARSYNNLITNQNIPKLGPPRSTSNVLLGNGNYQSTTSYPNSNGNSGMGGKRFSSVRLKSGSNLSLNQLWTGNTSQNFLRGLVVTVSGPTRVKLGESFRWKIQLLNKSIEKMDLILYVQSSIKKEYEKTVPPIPIQSGNKNDIVPLFTNNQLVRSFYYKFNRAGLVSLTNNIRVSLEYGNLYECELELISVERGMFNIYDFKVLDIASGDIFECNRLLDVIVE